VAYAQLNKVATHPRIRGYEQCQVDINHYLDTLMRKPGAVKNSVALRSQQALKAIFDEHFSKRARDFVALLKENEGLPINELLSRISKAAIDTTASSTRPVDTIAENVRKNTRRQLELLTNTFTKGGERYAS
jgi:hypothetical protein